MKKLWLWALLCGSPFACALNGGALDSCTPCKTTCCGSFEAFGYALWMKPSTCNRKFAIKDPTYFDRLASSDRGRLTVPPIGSAFGECPHHEWGFRVGAGYVACNGRFDGRIYYSRVHRSDAQALLLDGPGVLWPERVPVIQLRWGEELPQGASSVLTNPDQVGAPSALGVLARAAAKTRFEWDAVDAEVATRVTGGCGFFLRAYVGLGWTELCRKARFLYQGTTLSTANGPDQAVNAFIDVEAKSRTWGVGPSIGINARYPVFCGLGLTARAGAAVFAGEVSARQTSLLTIQLRNVDCSSSSSETFFDAIWPANCALFPEYHAALGVSYERCCCCVTLRGEVGYEFRTYLNPLNTEFFNDSKSAAASSLCDPFNLRGLYFGLLACF